MFDKTQKFVQDTQYFCTIIQSEVFYERNSSFHKQAMVRYESYCDVNEDELIKEVNSSPLQTCFDDYKRLLNNVDIPNKDTISMSWHIQEYFTSDRQLLEDAISIFETIVEKCGNFRNSITDFMELYSLKDNFPKKGFLCPLFVDEVLIKTDDDENTIKIEQEAIPNEILLIFRDKESAEEYLNWKEHTKNPRDWGRRYKDYGKPKNRLSRGDLKLLFEYLRKLYPEIDDDIEKFRRYA